MINKVIIVGNVGQNPDIKTMSNGERVCNLSVATSESWKDKQSGERKTKTEWHRVSIFNKALVDICDKYITKGSKLYIEGKLQTHSYDKDGVTHYTTSIVLQGYNGQIQLLDSKEKSNDGSSDANQQSNDYVDDDIPF